MRTTIITQESVNNPQSRLTEANHILLIIQVPADRLTKQSRRGPCMATLLTNDGVLPLRLMWSHKGMEIWVAAAPLGVPRRGE